MPPFIHTTRHDDVLVVEIDNPPVNALSPGVPDAIGAALDVAGHDPAVKAIVMRGAGRMFVAGADITRLEAAAWGDESAVPDWHDMFRLIEDCRVPVIMAIHGAALGGGLELAMAGHYRIAAAAATIGQPEVNLGVIPGAEGTQRLPRLAGVAKALEMCVMGRPITAPDAVAAGILDEIAGDDLTASAVAFARRVLDGRAHRRTRERDERLGSPEANAASFAAARALAASTRPFQIAPLKVIEAIDHAVRLPFDEGWRRERALFRECLRGEQAKALIHVFFAARALKKRAASSADQMEAADARMMRRWKDEWNALLAEGIAAADIDRALADFGFTTTAAADGTAAATPGLRPAGAALVERCVDAVVNEGARVLESDADMRASDLDALFVERHRFPAWRGGPMFHADRIGLANVLARVGTLHARHGTRWSPAPLLVELARAGGTFRDRDRAQPGA